MDARKKKVLTILCIGSLVLVWRGYTLLDSAGPVAAQAGVDGAENHNVGPAKSVKVSDEMMKEALLTQEKVEAGKWGRDPFTDLSEVYEPPEPVLVEPKASELGPPPESPSLRFKGVAKSGKTWSAIVRDDIVLVGDVIDEEYTVIEITKWTITLSSGGWTLRYQLGSEEADVRPLWEYR